jgi:hypothetical protein
MIEWQARSEFGRKEMVHSAFLKLLVIVIDPW